MQQSKPNRMNMFYVFAVMAMGLILSACSSGGSDGGTVAGVGSSSVAGNVSSYTMAMLEKTDDTEYSIADFFKSLLPLQSAYADTAVQGIHVGIGALGTITDANGYFMINGVPPGVHQVTFTKNGSVSYASVSVGDNEITTMHNVGMNGQRAHVQNVSHSPRSGHVGIQDNDRGAQTTQHI